MPRREPWRAVNVDCPFYLWSEKRDIICEGASEGIKARSMFTKAEDCDAYMKKHCTADFKSCPTYQAAMRKYEEEDT